MRLLIWQNFNGRRYITQKSSIHRYNSEGKPIEVMLVDLQIHRMASLGSDLAYLLYTSLHGEVRRANLDLFLTIYYEIFRQVLQNSDGERVIPFTLQELRQEYEQKRELALLFATWNLFIIHSPAQETGDLTSNLDEKVTEEVIRETYKKALQNYSKFRTRFLGLYIDTHEFQTDIL